MFSQVVHLLILLGAFANSQTPITEGNPTKPPRYYLLQYNTSPKHVQIDLEGGFYRYAYVTDDQQYKAERRKGDGTVIGYYGYVNPDGKAVRVNYTAGKDTGFLTQTEEVELNYPTGYNEENPSKTVPDTPPQGAEAQPTADGSFQIILGGSEDPSDSTINFEKDSISVESPMFGRSSERDDIYRHPLITFPLIRPTRSLHPSPAPQRVFRREVTNLQEIQETIRKSYALRKNPYARYVRYEIYERPILVLADAADSVLLTASAHYKVQD